MEEWVHDPDLIRPPDHVTTYQISADGSVGSVGESQKAPSLFSIEKGTRRQVQKGKDLLGRNWRRRKEEPLPLR